MKQEYVVTKLIGMHEKCEEIMDSRKEILEVLDEYGWDVADETELTTNFIRIKDSDKAPDFVELKFIEGEWKLRGNCYLENTELLIFSDYIDVRRQIDGM